jgi:hypothetical protein
MKYLLILLSFLTFSSYGACDNYVITLDDCYINITCGGQRIDQIPVNGMSAYQYGTLVKLQNGSAYWNGRITDISNYATVALLFADIDSWQASCVPSGTVPNPIQVINNTNDTLNVKGSVTSTPCTTGNDNESFALVGASQTFTANTYSSISFMVIAGLVSVTDNITVNDFEAGYGETRTAGECLYLQNAVTIDATSGVCRVLTIK